MNKLMTRARKRQVSQTPLEICMEEWNLQGVCPKACHTALWALESTFTRSVTESMIFKGANQCVIQVLFRARKEKRCVLNPPIL